MKYPCFAIHNPSNELCVFINDETSYRLLDGGRRFVRREGVKPTSAVEFRIIEFATAYSILHPKKRREDGRYTPEAGRIIYRLITEEVIKRVKLGSGFIRTITDFQTDVDDSIQCYEVNGTWYEPDLTNVTSHDIYAGLDIIGIPDRDARKAFKKAFAKAYPKDYPCIMTTKHGSVYYIANERDNFLIEAGAKDAPKSINLELTLAEPKPIDWQILDTYYHGDLQPVEYMDGDIFNKEAAHILIELMQEKKLKGNLKLNTGQTCKAAIYNISKGLGGTVIRLPWLDDGSESSVRFDEDLTGRDTKFGFSGVNCLLDNDDHRTFLHRYALRYHKA